MMSRDPQAFGSGASSFLARPTAPAKGGSFRKLTESVADAQKTHKVPKFDFKLEMAVTERPNRRRSPPNQTTSALLAQKGNFHSFWTKSAKVGKLIGEVDAPREGEEGDREDTNGYE